MSLLMATLFVCCKTSADEDNNLIEVKVLSIKSCEATPPTIDLVNSVAEELKIKINLTHVTVETSEQAQKERFIGSPTVQINERDIDHDSRETQHFGIT